MAVRPVRASSRRSPSPICTTCSCQRSPGASTRAAVITAGPPVPRGWVVRSRARLVSPRSGMRAPGAGSGSVARMSGQRGWRRGPGGTGRGRAGRSCPGPGGAASGGGGLETYSCGGPFVDDERVPLDGTDDDPVGGDAEWWQGDADGGCDLGPGGASETHILRTDGGFITYVWVVPRHWG